MVSETAIPSRAASTPAREAWRAFAGNPAAMAGLALFIVIALVAGLGPLLYPVDPFAIVSAPMSPPASDLPLGSDYLGRDVLAGLLDGGRVTLVIGISATCCTVSIGVLIGAFAGFYGGWIDAVLMRVTEFFQVLPPLLLAMVLVTLFSPNLMTVIVSIGLVNWTGVARVTRAEFLRIRQQEFVLAERAMGAPTRRIMWRTILPNALPSLIVITTLLVGTAILFEAALSYLGLTDPNVMTWGLMIGQSRNYIWETWWAVTFPGLAIVLTVLGNCLIGDGLTKALNPATRAR